MSIIDTLHAKLNELANTPSINAKLEIVKTFTQGHLSILTYALDESWNFYMKKLPEHTLTGTGDWHDMETTQLLVALAERRITGNEARDAVAKQLSGLCPAHAEVLAKVILKDLRCGVGETLINKAFPGTIATYPYMRCSLPEKSNLHKWGVAIWDTGAISDEKADGMFASLTTYNDGEVRILSRQGSTFPKDALPGLATAHPALIGKQLHGELLVVGPRGNILERQTGNGILNSLLQGGEMPEGHSVKYVVWDIIPIQSAVPNGKCAKPLLERREELISAVALHPAIDVIESRRVHSKEEAIAHCKELMAMGKEGTILKDPFATWKDGTSKDFVKFKLQVDVELRVVGITPGSGKNILTFGSITCESACGQLRVDVSGFTDKDRKAFRERFDAGTLVGSIFTVRANLLMKPSESNLLHSLFLPRFVEERLDKKEADTLSQVIEQFEAALK